MNDLIRWMCLYAQEHRMGGLWSDPEYRACNQVSTACIEALEEQLDGEGRKQLRVLLDQTAFQNGLEQEYLFWAALSMARELEEQLRPAPSRLAP